MNKIIIKCKEDNKFEPERKIIHSCNSNFTLEKENIFCANTPDFFGETMKQYYAICPNCGYIVLLSVEDIPEDIRLYAEKLSKEDPLLYRKNSLKSELIHLESITPKVRKRVLF